MGLIFYLFYQGEIPTKGSDFTEKGQFGDSFGVLNSLFTGLGFGGLIVTLILQQKQIAYQEAEAKKQRKIDSRLHYEDILYRLLDIYTSTLNDVSTKKGDLRGRTMLRVSIDKAIESIKKEKMHLIPLRTQQRYDSKKLTADDEELLDYLYFRNFKILSTELDRQGRLVDTLKVLLRHLVCEAPEHTLIKPYCDLICAQLTSIEVSYFFLISLAFKDEDELRDLFAKSKLIEKGAYISRLRVHDYMYEQFWGINIRQHKEPQLLPMSDARISNAVRAYQRKFSSSAMETVFNTDHKADEDAIVVALRPNGSAEGGAHGEA